MVGQEGTASLLMRKHNTKLIVNPNADLGRAWRLAGDLRPVIEEFGGADWSGTVYPTHATELAKEAALQGYPLVVAVGGDGTVHEVINGLMQVPQEERPRLGVVPLGTGNDFAHMVGISTHSVTAARQVFTGKPRPIDIFKVSDDHGRCEYVDNTLGIGFDALVNIRSRNVPVIHGFFVYLLAVFQTILLNHDPPFMRFRSDLESWEREMLMLVACNGPREGGGFFVAPEARPDDGLLNYVGVCSVSRLMMLRLVPEVMRGTHARFSQVSMGAFHQMDLHSNKHLYMHADGEIFSGFGQDVRHVVIEVIPGAVEVMTTGQEQAA